jgi:hypothetical protein
MEIRLRSSGCSTLCSVTHKGTDDPISSVKFPLLECEGGEGSSTKNLTPAPHFLVLGLVFPGAKRPPSRVFLRKRLTQAARTALAALGQPAIATVGGAA